MPWLFGGALWSSLSLSFVLQVLVRAVGAHSLLQGAALGLALWGGLCVPVLLGTLWEGRKATVVAINAGNYLFVCLLFPSVLAVWL